MTNDISVICHFVVLAIRRLSLSTTSEKMFKLLFGCQYAVKILSHFLVIETLSKIFSFISECGKFFIRQLKYEKAFISSHRCFILKQLPPTLHIPFMLQRCCSIFIINNVNSHEQKIFQFDKIFHSLPFGVIKCFAVTDSS